MPIDIIKKMFENTTQYGRTPVSTIIKSNYTSPFPALNVCLRHEPVTADTVYFDIPAIDYGATSAQIFVRNDVLLTDVRVIKSDKQFTSKLSNNFRQCGAMGKNHKLSYSSSH